jgi:hypothetical protein
MSTSALAGCGEEEAPTKDVKALSPAHAVRAADIDVTELPAGFTVEKFQPMGNDELRGETSLELCWPSLKFPSERQREARHATRFIIPGGHGGMNYELVAYKAGAAEQALNEVREAVESCPDRYVDPEPELGLPAEKAVLELLPQSDGWLPGSVAVRQTSYAKGEVAPINVTTVVYQRRGDLLSILTFRTPESADKYLDDVAETQSEHLAAVDLG